MFLKRKFTSENSQGYFFDFQCCEEYNPRIHSEVYTDTSKLLDAILEKTEELLAEDLMERRDEDTDGDAVFVDLVPLKKYREVCKEALKENTENNPQSIAALFMNKFSEIDEFSFLDSEFCVKYKNF